MIKTPSQQRLEAKRDEDIRVIVPSTLEKFRGRINIVTLSAADLGVSTVTLYNWCRELGIDINEYRRQEVGA